ncbi:MAG: hypothetical protein ACKN9D_12045 [Actinomycetales bacterium]
MADVEPGEAVLCVVVNAAAGWRMIIENTAGEPLTDGWSIEQQVTMASMADARVALGAIRRQISRSRHSVPRLIPEGARSDAWPVSWGTFDLVRLRELVEEFYAGVEDLWVAISLGELREAVRDVLTRHDASGGVVEGGGVIDAFMEDYRDIMRPLSNTWVAAFVDGERLTIQPEVLEFLSSADWNELMQRRQRLWQARRLTGQA